MFAGSGGWGATPRQWGRCETQPSGAGDKNAAVDGRFPQENKPAPLAD
jgi:hypothetical protein